MRLRLLIRRLTVSSPRMAIRSAMPWPLRWAVAALVLGLSAAIALWAFNFGKSIAGIGRADRDELLAARQELVTLRDELASYKSSGSGAQWTANTANTLQTSDRVAIERLMEKNRQLEATNHALRDDLDFFERLIPTTNVGGVAIRALQAEVSNSGDLKWRVMLIQAVKNAVVFDGQLELVFSGTLNGKPWQESLPEGAQTVKVKQLARLEGIYRIPPSVQVKGITAKLLAGGVIRTIQSVKL